MERRNTEEVRSAKSQKKYCTVLPVLKKRSLPNLKKANKTRQNQQEGLLQPFFYGLLFLFSRAAFCLFSFGLDVSNFARLEATFNVFSSPPFQRYLFIIFKSPSTPFFAPAQFAIPPPVRAPHNNGDLARKNGARSNSSAGTGANASIVKVSGESGDEVAVALVAKEENRGNGCGGEGGGGEKTEKADEELDVLETDL